MKGERKRIRYLIALAMVMCALFLAASSANAAAYKKKWVRSGGYTYYYDAKGNKVTGLKKIGKKTYYFDSYGIQRTGWRNINGYFYFFRIAHAAKGYMQKNVTIDGVKISSDGRAYVTDANKRKLIVMDCASKLVDQNTVPSWSFARKRRAMFEYTAWNYGNSWIPDYFYESDYDAAYAEILFYRGYGDCFAFAAGFGYFMNAIGYHNVVVAHNTKHCWIEWNNHTFDPHWYRSYPYTNTYYISPAQNGTGGRPDLISISIYHKNIDKA